MKKHLGQALRNYQPFAT